MPARCPGFARSPARRLAADAAEAGGFHPEIIAEAALHDGAVRGCRTSLQILRRRAARVRGETHRNNASTQPSWWCRCGRTHRHKDNCTAIAGLRGAGALCKKRRLTLAAAQLLFARLPLQQISHRPTEEGEHGGGRAELPRDAGGRCVQLVTAALIRGATLRPVVDYPRPSTARRLNRRRIAGGRLSAVRCVTSRRACRVVLYGSSASAAAAAGSCAASGGCPAAGETRPQCIKWPPSCFMRAFRKL